ncbi:MAG TPA: pseudouridine synthase [Planctomycetota bacterium]|nr:pseudouridine synthase [Planctomycetota bacterium]HRR81560.1 pseudouridine synthase [Planctomycetota bacterium]HRT93411.1 pseudouridine synthase [Planctomycetota bacterium]
MSLPEGRILMLHKPKGVVVTRRDERGRKTVYDVLPDWALAGGWVPVGRLDQDSTGLLLLVKEGELVERLTRPGACPKTYEVWVRGRVTAEHLEAIRRGIPSPVGLLTAIRVETLGGAGPKSRLRVTLDEGRNRHIRRLFGALRDPKFGTPLKVVELKRTQMGPLALDVPSGSWRFLSESEATALLGGRK